MKTNKTLKTVALMGLMGSALLLTGCGGGSSSGGSSYVPPVEFGTIGNASAYVTDLHGNSFSVGALASDVELVNTFEIGTPYRTVWEGASSELKNILLLEINKLTLVDIEVSDIDNSLDLLDSYTLDQQDLNTMRSATATFINSFNTSGKGTAISGDDVLDASNLLISHDVTSAWRQGWVGTGVTISRTLESADNNSDSYRSLMLSKAIAPGATVENINSNSQIKLIRRLDNGSMKIGVEFDRGTPGNDFTVFTMKGDTTERQGYIAGAGALVMQKFPTASNHSVAGAVIDTTSVLDALSPQ